MPRRHAQFIDFAPVEGLDPAPKVQFVRRLFNRNQVQEKTLALEPAAP